MKNDSSRHDPLASDETRQLAGIGSTDQSHGENSERWPQHQWPREIGNNVIVGKLGEGGAAIVFDAINKDNGHKRAVKVLFPDSSLEDRNRFVREIAISSQLQHSNTIGAIEQGEWEYLPYLTMKKVEGKSLAGFLKDHERLPASVVAALGYSAASTLFYCHSLTYTLDGNKQAGIVHRDIKPSNLIVGNDGEIYIADFSIATPISWVDKEENPYGSVPYFAPEIIEKKSVDQRCDIFSLGCTLYEALSGVRAFDAEDVETLMEKRKKHQFDDLKTLVPDAPPRLIKIISQCMAYDPDERPESMEELEKQLDAILKKMSNQPHDMIVESFLRGHSASKKSRHPLGLVWIGIAVITIASSIVGYMYSPLPDKLSSYLPWITEKKEDLLEKVSFFNDDSRVVPDGPISNDTAPRRPRSSKQMSEPTPDKQITFNPNRKTEKVVRGSTQNQKPVEKKPPRSAAPPDQLLSDVSRPSQGGDTVRHDADNQPEEELTLTQHLMEKHNTTDMLEVLRKEATDQHWENVLIILDEFPEKQRRSPLAQIYRLRALDKTNRINESVFNKIDADDGEIHLIKGKLYHTRGNYQKALNQSSIARRSPVMLLERSQLQKQAILLEARCRSALYRESPDESTYKSAMESWVQVKSNFRDNRSSPVVAEANQAIRELIKAKKQLNTVEN
ncbi:MAG: serine/threonine protein kinase [Fibrobacterota bacterium]